MNYRHIIIVLLALLLISIFVRLGILYNTASELIRAKDAVTIPSAVADTAELHRIVDSIVVQWAQDQLKLRIDIGDNKRRIEALERDGR